jgi:hypothetical protein
MQKLDPNLAIKSIFVDEQWLVKTGIGGMSYAASMLLLLLNFFTLPLVIIVLACTQGYLLRVMREEVAAPDSKLPGWGDVVDLFFSGLTWMAINVSFAGLGLLVSLGLVFLLVWTSMPQICLHFPAGGGIVVGLGALFYALVSFTLTFLMVNLAVQETNTAGFQLLLVLKRAWSNKAEFLAAWLIGEGLKLVCSVVPLATVFGAFLLPSTLFIAQIAAAKLAAQAWQAGIEPSSCDKIPRVELR